MTLVAVERRDDGVWVLSLTDPDRRNAIGAQLRDELAAAVAAVDDDSEARVLIVAGQGVALCGGANLAELFGPPGRLEHELRTDLIRVYDSFLSIRSLTIPSIAVVHGAAVGAGANLAMACDLRMFGPAGYLDVSFAKLGLHPGGGATWFLTQALGPARAIELILRGGRISAERALELGIANSVTEDPLSAAYDAAVDISRLDPALARSMRATVQLAVRGSLAEVVDAEARAQAASMIRSPKALLPRISRSAPADSVASADSRPTECLSHGF
jgi:enoyl-CoA hydratase